ncbi:Dihydroorotate dehydrogenase B (NAD(+)), electron transfer subunit [Maioricimonas rarisocia]|uniref:Dihydroorotate dehydrogenase B (NAD(+)), electron transfer subunit n=1 Tax=Maioricimonas rarisocia TaxID=2528026 RepID=A0A517Z1X9_9PLAN|nr:dihydroorotate dehydrogenase electron transfer subunit [Maioricimonas rarisocia]QDU36483.1 Dihydroorotate dehydrogenase B (NAD(+)), electron transfer subunit [Maioricimonas rarisocia]
MQNPTPFPGMNDCARQLEATVVEQQQLAEGTYRIRLATPDLARVILPGQFFMVRPADGTDPLLGRPFALYDTYLDDAGEPAGIDFVYHVIGKMTGLMSGWSGGEEVTLWGPLGNGFPVPDVGHLMCVGGGIGYTPFLAVAREAAGLRQYGDNGRTLAEPARKVTLCYGVRTRAHRSDLTDFEAIPACDLRVATDDGTEGHHGLVTDLLRKSLETPAERPDAVYCCGPEPMMHAVADVCEDAGVSCWLSLETPMACGFGACFSCVTKVRVPTEEGWDYRRTCIEGPVFPAETLVRG